MVQSGNEVFCVMCVKRGWGGPVKWQEMCLYFGVLILYIPDDYKEI